MERVIVFALYRGVTQLDFTGPHQVFTRVPGARVLLASRDGGDLEADGLRLAGLARLEDIPVCEVLCVPGGPGATAAGLDEAFIGQLARLAAGATWVTSVCTGSLILGAAGLLKGRRATTHWAWRDLLPLFGALPESGRVVCDRPLLTGGGVTAGIDFALTLAAQMAGAETAQAIQLAIQYAPDPPFGSGSPEGAPPAVLKRVLEQMEPLRARRVREAQQAAARLAPEGRPG